MIISLFRRASKFACILRYDSVYPNSLRQAIRVGFDTALILTGPFFLLVLGVLIGVGTVHAFENSIWLGVSQIAISLIVLAGSVFSGWRLYFMYRIVGEVEESLAALDEKAK